jgi:4-amino-4-deoxychorismate lyase
MAAKREATSQHADDVLFMSEDNQVLEGPNSTLLWLKGKVIATTSSRTGILRGTTQEEIFAKAGSAGLDPTIAAASLDDILDADGVWMSSSTRGVAAVREIDGIAVAQSPETTRLLQGLSGLPLP